MTCVVSNEMAGRLSPVPAGELVVGPLPAQGQVEFSLVVPTRNESHNLAELIGLLTPAIASEVGDSYEIIVVDDDSPDKTWQVAAAMAASDNPSPAEPSEVCRRAITSAKPTTDPAVPGATGK